MGIRPIKRDFLEEPPDVPTWAPLTVSFYDEKAEETDEYFESANEPLAGSVAPQPKLVNNKPIKQKKNKGAPQELPSNTKFNFGQNLKDSNKGPPMDPIQEQQIKVQEQQRRASEARQKKQSPEQKVSGDSDG